MNDWIAWLERRERELKRDIERARADDATNDVTLLIEADLADVQLDLAQRRRLNESSEALRVRAALERNDFNVY